MEPVFPKGLDTNGAQKFSKLPLNALQAAFQFIDLLVKPTMFSQSVLD
jgi:hypothetical protein